MVELFTANMEEINLTLQITNKNALKVVNNAKYLILLCSNGEAETFVFGHNIDEYDDEETPVKLPEKPKLKPQLVFPNYI